MILGKVAWCSDWLGQWRIKQVFVDVICLWPAGGNLGGIYAIVWYLNIYPFQLRGKRPTRVILENHGCKFTHSWETAVKPTCVCVWTGSTNGSNNGRGWGFWWFVISSALNDTRQTVGQLFQVTLTTKIKQAQSYANNNNTIQWYSQNRNINLTENNAIKGRSKILISCFWGHIQ
jgi:hypothetical protein